MKIKDSTALVTGANRGIGLGLVTALLKHGVKRVYAAARNPQQLEAVVALDPDRVVALQIDITDDQQVKAAGEKAKDVTLLINNAGVLGFGSFLDGDVGQIERDMTTNYFGTLKMTRAFVPVLEGNGGGAMTNILSVVSLANMPGIAGYSASKAAAFSMTQSIRAALAGKKIAVHAVYPGPIDTDMAKDFEMDKAGVGETVAAVIEGIESDVEDIFPDPMAKQVKDLWKQDPKALERQFGAM